MVIFFRSKKQYAKYGEEDKEASNAKAMHPMHTSMEVHDYLPTLCPENCRREYSSNGNANLHFQVDQKISGRYIAREGRRRFGTTPHEECEMARNNAQQNQDVRFLHAP